ncbi:SBBP repeat-containing protein [Flavobacterium sp.]|uniref:SBBP repeat-containing protein n=1 Tax=Flavobacterium sp. TaxID=239 RepID=UPI003750364F
MNKKLPAKQTQFFTTQRVGTRTLTFFLFFVLLQFTNMHAQSPNLAWAKAVGSTGIDDSRSVTVDAAGNVYTIGQFSGTVDFDPNTGVFNLTSASGSNDVFVSKLDSSGNLVWAKALGGAGVDIGHGISVDAAGNVYTTGRFQGTVDFDPNAGVFNLVATGATVDVFVSKLNASGNLVWAKAMGGTSTDIGYGIALDPIGNVYTTGYFQGTADFDPNAGVFNLTSTSAGGSLGVFVSKLDASGNFVWAKAMTSTIGVIGYGIVADTAGNVYTTGYFEGNADFDPNAGVFNLASAGGSADFFISKLDASGNLVWAKVMGGTGSDYAYSIAVDTTGNVYTTGYFEGIADFDPNVGVFNLTSSGVQDVFISKLNASGNFVWAKAMGSTGSDYAYSIAIDTTGNVYTTGSFFGTVDFDPNAGILNLTSAGGNDVFASKLDTSGNMVWAKAMGGSGSERGYGITVDASGNVYTTGNFEGTADFDPNVGVSNLTSFGVRDIFVHKMSVSAAALNFDGFNDRITVATQPLSNLTNFTIEAWVYTTNAGSYQTIYAEGNTIDDNPMFSFTKLGGTAGFEIVLRNASAVGLVVSGTSGKLPLNTWTHVSFVRTSATTASLYINGINTDNFTYANPGTITTNVTNIGVRQRTGFDGYLNGNLDEVRLWNRALTQAEIMNNMNCELPTGQTGLLSYYQFNQGQNGADNSTINTLTDASGNGNTGTLTNFARSGTTSNWVLPGGVTTGNACSPFLSTSDFEFSSKLTIYPNPSSDIFTLNSETRGNIVVYDLIGKIIKSETIDLGITKLDLNNYPSGIYLMKVTNDNNQTKTMKLIKQ